jgi:antitoxin (DNA-binding transcriptional repressor) of toxin-antitoxin stability system
MSIIVALETDAHLPHLLELVARGDSITLTKEGVAVAMLVPTAASDRPDAREAVQELLKFRENHRLTQEEFQSIVVDSGHS